MSLFAHICGFSGAGKTTLGEKISTTYPSLRVKDIDDFFYEEDDEDLSYNERREMVSERICSYIDSVEDDTKIILIGTGCINTVDEEFPYLYATHKIWLDVSIEESCSRSIKRQIDLMYNNKDSILDMMRDMTLHEINDYMNSYMNYQTKISYWWPLRDIAKRREYKDMSEEEIIRVIGDAISV